MALKIDLNWRGVKVPGAYVRLLQIQGGKHLGAVSPQQPGLPLWHAVFGAFANETEQVPIFTVDVQVPFDTETSPFPALYAALKTSAEFQGAEDA